MLEFEFSISGKGTQLCNASRQESAMLIAISTTKHENLGCHSEEPAFADDRRISDNSAELSTEILTLSGAKGKNLST